MRIARLALAFLTLGWLALLTAAPATALGVPVSAGVYAFGSLICHQRPDRSFHLGAAQLPVCARCFGLYAGAALGAAGVLLRPGRSPVQEQLASRLRAPIVLAAGPTIVTWSLEAAGLWLPTNATRFAAALPLGAVIAWAVAAGGGRREAPALR